MLKKRKLAVFIICVFSILALTGLTCYADYSTDHIFRYKFYQDGTTLEYFKDYSVSQYGYTDVVDEAVSEWSAESSNIDIDETDSDVNKKGIIAYYVGEDILINPNHLGQADYWRYTVLSGWYNVYPNSSVFDRVRIQIDHKHLVDHGINNYYCRKGVSLHETGHALSLNHFDEGSNPHDPDTEPAIMYSDITISSIYTIEALDIDHLQYKWGE